MERRPELGPNAPDRGLGGMVIAALAIIVVLVSTCGWRRGVIGQQTILRLEQRLAKSALRRRNHSKRLQHPQRTDNKRAPKAALLYSRFAVAADPDARQAAQGRRAVNL